MNYIGDRAVASGVFFSIKSCWIQTECSVC